MPIQSIYVRFLVLELLLLTAFFPNLFIGGFNRLVGRLFQSSPPDRNTGAHLTTYPPTTSTSTVTITTTVLTTATSDTMSWFQKTFTLPARSRGSYLITDHIVQELPEIRTYKVGMLNLFIQHTSCALSLNENWDEDVREDMSDALDRIAPEDRKGNLYRHSAEGQDDMPVCPTTPPELSWPSAIMHVSA